MAVNDFEDPFGLGGHRVGHGLSIRFGDYEVGGAATAVTATNKVNSIGEARFELDTGKAAIRDLDYSSTVVISAGIGKSHRTIFTGYVIDVMPSNGKLAIKCSAMPALSERKVSRMQTYGMPNIELLYTLARGGGLRDSQIKIDGLDGLPQEVFEIIVPVKGVTISSSFKIGQVLFTRRDNVARISSAFGGDEAVSDFLESDGFAVTYETASFMLEAESQGLQNIDLALAWLTVRARFSLPVLPDMSIPAWSRSASLAIPSRADLVGVRGISSKRAWVRVPQQSVALVVLNVEEEHSQLMNPRLPDHLLVNLRQAILACSRAAQSQDSVAAITALWEAVEFYVGTTAPPALYSRADKKAIRRGMPTFAEPMKQARLEEAIGYLNNAPLFTRFRHRLALDGVPVSQVEIDLLSRLRKIRNDAVHGKQAGESSSDDIRQGIAIVARILVYAISRSKH